MVSNQRLYWVNDVGYETKFTGNDYSFLLKSEEEQFFKKIHNNFKTELDTLKKTFNSFSLMIGRFGGRLFILSKIDVATVEIYCQPFRYCNNL